eukprot:1180181-Prorocentrum_minimum.AAC.13
MCSRPPARLARLRRNSGAMLWRATAPDGGVGRVWWVEITPWDGEVTPCGARGMVWYGTDCGFFGLACAGAGAGHDCEPVHEDI